MRMPVICTLHHLEDEWAGHEILGGGGNKQAICTTLIGKPRLTGDLNIKWSLWIWGVMVVYLEVP